mgnify:CR=1 FL=1
MSRYFVARALFLLVQRSRNFFNVDLNHRRYTTADCFNSISASAEMDQSGL